MKDPRTDVLRMLAERAAHPECTDGSLYWYDDWERDRFMDEADLIDAFVAWGEAAREMVYCRNCKGDGCCPDFTSAPCDVCEGSGLR